MVLVLPLFEMHQPRRLRRQFGRGVQHGGKLESAYFDEGLDREIFGRVSRNAYIPALRSILGSLEVGSFRCALCVSGLLLEQAAAWNQELISLLRRIADTGSCELIAEPYYNSLSCLISAEELGAQFEMERVAIERLFGQTPKTAKNTAFISREDVWKVMRALGFKSALVEGSERLLGGRPPGFLYSASETDLRLIPRDYPLSDLVNFGYLSWKGESSGDGGGRVVARNFMELLKSRQSDLILLDFNLETFGEHFESSILGFLDDLPREGSVTQGIEWETPEGASALLEARGSVVSKEYSSCAGSEKDLSPWLGNAFQGYCLDNLRYLYPFVKGTTDELRVWRLLGQNDLFLYMSLKGGDEGAIYSSFSHFSSPVEAYSTFLWSLSDFRARLYSRLGDAARYHRILRGDLPEAHSFHFYVEFGKPLGVRATNLLTLRDAISSINEESLKFHLSRGDLRRWVGEVLGCIDLADAIRELEGGVEDASIRESLLAALDRSIVEARSRIQARTRGGEAGDEARAIY